MIVRTDEGVYLPALYARTAAGKIQRWRVWASAGVVYTQHGLVDGKEQRTVGRAAGTTNAGRANERGPVEQAIFEAEALWRNRLERKYRRTPEEVASAPARLPMLAKDYWSRPRGKPVAPSPAARKLEFPCYAQAKLNGVRCLARLEGGEVVLTSRAGKTWTVPHVAEAVRRVLSENLLETLVLDGELYRHGLSLQQITSLARDPGSDVLEYHVYDCADAEDPGAPQSRRLAALASIRGGRAYPVMVVGSHLLLSRDEVEAEERSLVSRGFEGLILRARAGRYRWAARSADLLKVKTFEDHEFVVVDVTEGRGKHAARAVIVCRNDVTDATFRVIPKASQNERRRLWVERAKLPGRLYTVRHFGRSDDGLPLLPVGVAFRDPRDLPPC